MKNTELTLKNWVVFEYDYNTIHAQVAEIGETLLCVIGDMQYRLQAEDVFAITVTDDDLILNGFKFTQVTQSLMDFSLTVRNKVNDGEAEEVTTISVRVKEDDTESFNICIDKRLEWGESIAQRKNILHFERWGVLLVHELQNYLHMAGLHDLANNFKMDYHLDNE